MAPPSKPEPPAKTEKARISSKELIEKQKNWIQHFKGTGTGSSNNKPAVQAKPAALLLSSNNQINSNLSKPEVVKRDWSKERSGVLAHGWMASPNNIQNSSSEPTVLKTPEVKEIQQPEEEPIINPVPEADVSQVESVIEEALERIDRNLEPVVSPPSSFLLNSSLPESEEVYYDNSVTSARFDEWQLRTPTQLDDSPVLKSNSTPLDFDALLSDGDETKQLEPDDEELFRAVSADLSETELSPISSPPPEFSKPENPPTISPEPLLIVEPEIDLGQNDGTQLVIQLEGFSELLESSDETAVDSLEPELVQQQEEPVIKELIIEDVYLTRPQFRVDGDGLDAQAIAASSDLMMTPEEADSLLSTR